MLEVSRARRTQRPGIVGRLPSSSQSSPDGGLLGQGDSAFIGDRFVRRAVPGFLAARTARAVHAVDANRLINSLSSCAQRSALSVCVPLPLFFIPLLNLLYFHKSRDQVLNCACAVCKRDS
ncbi:hypothetical protein MRX96_003865 [Rhipicephalus microplus]